MPISQLERYFAVVRNSSFWGKLNYNQQRRVYPAIRAVLERMTQSPKADPDLFDWAVEIQTLFDYEFLDDWIESLEAEGKLFQAEFSQAVLDYAEQELSEHAAALGKYVLDSKEYHFLKTRDERLRKLEKKADGWPLSLC